MLNYRTIFVVIIAFSLTGCAEYNTIDLPDLNTKSFSYEDMLMRKSELEKRILEIQTDENHDK